MGAQTSHADVEQLIIKPYRLNVTRATEHLRVKQPRGAFLLDIAPGWRIGELLPRRRLAEQVATAEQAVEGPAGRPIAYGGIVGCEIARRERYRPTGSEEEAANETVDPQCRWGIAHVLQ